MSRTGSAFARGPGSRSRIAYSGAHRLRLAVFCITPLEGSWGMGFGMIGGFNNNFRYRGILFHVQTEDSGVSNPHVITHLFHGGNILASEKLDYSEKLDLEEKELKGCVRELMEAQHKAMHSGLKSGLHDRVILERLGSEAFSEARPDEPGVTDESPTPPRLAARPAPPAAAEPVGGFGRGIVSQKPLDELVLDYLVENTRKRKRTTK